MKAEIKFLTGFEPSTVMGLPYCASLNLTIGGWHNE